MTLETLENAIIRLIIARRETDNTNTAEIDRINKKLDKLYTIKENYYKTLNK